MDENNNFYENSILNSTFNQKLIQAKNFLLFFIHSFWYLCEEFYNGMKRKLLNRPLFGTDTLENDLTGCVCLVNGAVAGSIGHVIIQKLLEKNCSLVITVHGDKKFAEESINNLKKNELKDFDPSLYRFEYLDFTSLNSIIKLIRKLNDESQQINFFINNAGVALKYYEATDDGFESQLQINFLGGCLLLIGLLPLIVKTAQLAKASYELKSKIVFTNSSAHKFFDLDLNKLNYAEESKYNFNTLKTYSDHKLYQLMFNFRFFDKIIQKNKMESFIGLINIHPGIIDSKMHNNFYLRTRLIYKIAASLMKKPEEGAINIVTPILSTDAFFNSSICLYLEDLKVSRMNEDCHNEELKDKVYKNTLSLLKSKIEQLNLPNELNPLIN